MTQISTMTRLNPVPSSGALIPVAKSGDTTPYNIDLSAAVSLNLKIGFGAVGDGVTSDTSAITSADAATGAKFAPYGTYLTTIVPTSLTGPYWGRGQIQDASNNKRAPWFSAISSAPASTGNDTTADTAFNGDLSKNQIAMEHRITGTATLGQPTTGYNYTNEAYPVFGYLYNTSGWNNSISDNTGRTAACFSRVKVYQAGQGDGVAYNASAFVTGARAGATSFLANPAGVLFNGDAFAGQSGVYLNCYETNAHDQGFDVACVGSVYNFDRNNNTGALGAFWGGLRFQSIGTKAVDNMVSAVGSFNGGIDFTPSTLSFGTNQGAILLQRGHRIYGNASSSNSNYATSLGTDYFANSASGWDFTCGGVIAGRIGSNGIGYVTGAGGAVTQATSKSTGVTLNKPCGQITLNNASLAANTVVSFTFTNSAIAATDIIRINTSGAATPGSYLVQAEALAAGSCTVSVRNLTAGALAEALVLNFAIIKAAAS